MFPRLWRGEHFAFIKSDYIVYTITETGTADVYLDTSDGAPVTITAKGGDGSKTVTDSIRVAITTQAVAVDGKTPVGEETLRVVYAKDNDKIVSIMKNHGDEIKSEVLAEEIVTGETKGYEKEWNINSEKVTMAVERI